MDYRFRNLVFEGGGVFENYPIKLFDREKYIKKTDLRKHARRTKYYQGQNRKIEKASSRYVYNKETLGFRLDTGREISMFRDGAEPDLRKIKDFFDYVAALVESILNAQNNQRLHSDDWHRTVYINTLGVGTTGFDIAYDRKIVLIKQGTEAVERYFDWYDRFDPEDTPVNHPDFRGEK
jgi:NTE family protein